MVRGSLACALLSSVQLGMRSIVRPVLAEAPRAVRSVVNEQRRVARSGLQRVGSRVSVQRGESHRSLMQLQAVQ